MVPEDLRNFFVASASVAGALIGLLFVAISVSKDRLADKSDAQVDRIRAHGALTAFTNALAVGLFALIPGGAIGTAVLAVSIAGLVFVIASLLSLLPKRHRNWTEARNALFLVGLAVVFVVELIQGAHLAHRADDSQAAQTLAILVVICFLIGIDRSWELIGGPTIGIGHQLRVLAGPAEHPDGVEPSAADVDRAAPG